MNTSTTPHTPEVALPSRREFLYYLGGISAALFSAGACGLLYQYVTRNVPLEQQEGVYEINLEMLPSVFEPVSIPEAKTALSIFESGLLALNKVCVFDAPNYDKTQVVWVGINNRFECPVCGSKFKLDGTFIEGLAPRGLDRFGLWIRTPEGRLIASEGEPISIDDAVQIFIDTRVKIPGQPRP
jgi:hypothetical protein